MRSNGYSESNNSVTGCRCSTSKSIHNIVACCLSEGWVYMYILLPHSVPGGYSNESHVTELMDAMWGYFSTPCKPQNHPGVAENIAPVGGPGSHWPHPQLTTADWSHLCHVSRTILNPAIVSRGNPFNNGITSWAPNWCNIFCYPRVKPRHIQGQLFGYIFRKNLSRQDGKCTLSALAFGDLAGYKQWKVPYWVQRVFIQSYCTWHYCIDSSWCQQGESETIH